MYTIISQLRAYRKTSDMTQADLAARLDVSRETVVALERNDCSPGLLLAYKIAKIFHCAVEDIFIYQKI